MNRRNWLVTAGVSAFLLFLIGGFPAAVAVRWLAPESLRLSGVAGTLWRGSALTVEIGKLRLGDTHWTTSPLTLIRGRMGGDVETRIGDGTAQGAIAVSLGGALQCTACKFEGPVASLRPMIAALRTLEGQLSLELTAIEISNKWPTRVVGSASLTDMPIGASGQTRRDRPLGAFTATLGANPVPESGLIEVTVQDAGGPLELSALISITPPGNFEFTGRAKARAGAPAELVNALAALGPKRPDGSAELGMSGSF